MMPRTKVRNSLADLRKVLLEEKAQLEWERRQAEPPATIGSGDSADQAAAFQEQFVALQRNDLQATKIRLVEAALARMETGEFGQCLECDEPIAPARLRAVPWASYCVSCQEQRDSKQDPEKMRFALSP